MKTIRMREHQTRTHNDLELTPSDMILAESLKDSTLTIREARRGIEITSLNYIGMARFADFEVVVEPKIEMKQQNLPALIAYVFDFDDLKMQKTKASFAPDGSYLIDVLIDFFCKGCRDLMAQGMLKSYVTHQDDVPFLRERILLQHQLVHMAKKSPMFACKFDELVYDNVENRILLYCLDLCSRIARSPNLKKDSTMLARQLSEVIQYVKICPEDFDIQYTRLNKHYETLHNLAKLIINSTGMGHFSGKNMTGSFFLDMNSIFERFVTKLFEDYHKYDVQSQKSRRAWRTDDRKLYIRTDILLDSKIIVDAKYKQEISRGDLYQIGFYAHEYRQCRGYAILPAHQHAQEEEIISDKQNIAVHVRTIDVDRTLDMIHDRMDKKLQDMLHKTVPPSVTPDRTPPSPKRD